MIKYELERNAFTRKDNWIIFNITTGEKNVACFSSTDRDLSGLLFQNRSQDIVFADKVPDHGTEKSS
jgi:hypothetical protein